VTAEDATASATRRSSSRSAARSAWPRLALPSLPKTPLLECGDRTMLGTVQIERATRRSQRAAERRTKPATSPSQLGAKASTRGAQIATIRKSRSRRAPPLTLEEGRQRPGETHEAAAEWNRTQHGAAYRQSGLPSGFRRSPRRPKLASLTMTTPWREPIPPAEAPAGCALSNSIRRRRDPPTMIGLQGRPASAAAHIELLMSYALTSARARRSRAARARESQSG